MRTENEIPASAVILLPKFIDVCRSIAEISSQRHKSGMKSFWVEKPLRPRPIRSNVQKGADKYTRLTPLLTVDRCLKKVCECAQFGGLAGSMSVIAMLRQLSASPSSLSLPAQCLCPWPSVFPRSEKPIAVFVDRRE